MQAMWDFSAPCSTVWLLIYLFQWDMLRLYCPTPKLLHAQNHETNGHAEFLQLCHGTEADALIVMAVILSTCLLYENVIQINFNDSRFKDLHGGGLAFFYIQIYVLLIYFHCQNINPEAPEEVGKFKDSSSPLVASPIEGDNISI